MRRWLGKLFRWTLVTATVMSWLLLTGACAGWVRGIRVTDKLSRTTSLRREANERRSFAIRVLSVSCGNGHISISRIHLLNSPQAATILGHFGLNEASPFDWSYSTDRSTGAQRLWIPPFVGTATSGTGVVVDAETFSIPYWLITLLALPLPARSLLLFRRRLVRRRRQKTGHCPTCGYDLRASPGRCPECGAATAL